MAFSQKEHNKSKLKHKNDYNVVQLIHFVCEKFIHFFGCVVVCE